MRRTPPVNAAMQQNRSAQVQITVIKKREYSRALALVERSFYALNAQDFSPRGQRSFLDYAAPGSFAYRQWHGHVTYVARDGAEIVGMLELRDKRHISMLFVDPERTRSGIGRALVQHALDAALRADAHLEALTVNSSPYALEFYRSIGFAATGPANNQGELITTPMCLYLGAQRAASIDTHGTA